MYADAHIIQAVSAFIQLRLSMNLSSYNSCYISRPAHNRFNDKSPMICMVGFFFSVAYDPNSCLGHLNVEVYRSHTIRHTHKHKKQTTMSSAGYEPVIPAIKRPKTYALDRTASGINNSRTTERFYA